MKARNGRQGTVRIIAGEWRGRRLPVADLPGLRPSGDRSRETLFNWLQGELYGARCLDLFAGTGVLGLEALSRGAASVVLVEKDRRAVTQLQSNVEMLKAGKARVVPADALSWLDGQPAGSFSLVFVDPPFGQGLAETALELLDKGPALQPGGRVYLETARTEVVAIPAGWEILKEQALGEVRMQLLRKRFLPDQAQTMQPADC